MSFLRHWYVLLIVIFVMLPKLPFSKQVTVELKYNEYRHPGALLLNMLIKDEAQHLQRTLPKWAKVIDFWIIGVDDANTDDSPSIIQKHLGHIPGEIVIVHFDGMGPTWDILVQHGIEHYPNATHGIIADADYMPMNHHLDRYELDVRCSKHMYTIWTEDHSNERKMDWIYRNIPGARVTRRTHQVVSAPTLPKQEVFQTLINLNIEERSGGYQDRTGNKNERYIKFLEADLTDYPGDTRTLYYLGYAHYNIFMSAKRKTEQHWLHLEKGIAYMKERILEEGEPEELWFTILKLGEIYETIYDDWDTSYKHYINCTQLDPERADAWFYIGQHYRTRGKTNKSLKYLKKAATLPMPRRSVFHWKLLYQCIANLEYGRAINSLTHVTKKQLEEVIRILKEADCTNQPGGNSEVNKLLTTFKIQLKRKPPEKIKSLDNLFVFIEKNYGSLKTNLIQLDINRKDFTFDDTSKDNPDTKGNNNPTFETQTLWTGLESKLQDMQHYKTVLSTYLNTARKMDDIQARWLSCRRYRQATTPYLRFFKYHKSAIKKKISFSLLKKWKKLNIILRNLCR